MLDFKVNVEGSIRDIISSFYRYIENVQSKARIN